MTELFGRLAPGVDLNAARAELQTVYSGIDEGTSRGLFAANGDGRIEAVRLRDQITSRARTVLLVLMAASVLVFIIACSNVANLILARTIRREGELAIRAALGASSSALRRTLLAESLLLCGAGAAARRFERRTDGGHPCALRLPLLGPCARSHRGLQHALGRRGTGDHRGSAPGFVPRLPSPARLRAWAWRTAACGSRAAPAARLRVFAVTQIAASFVLLAGASMLLKTLLSLQAAQTGFDMHHVLALNLPVMSYGKTPEQMVDFYRETIRRI